MCGIVGVWRPNGKRVSEENLSKAVNALRHRGPDRQYHTLPNPHVGLGHARLSIIDTSSGGDQPMSSDCGRYHLIFNGEIYNHHELKQELNDGSISWRGSSDTEVVLHALIRWGSSGLARFNGCFALAFYDRTADTLLLSRDHMGIKPLYYIKHDGGLLFASESRALAPLGLRPEVNMNSLFTYLQLNYLPPTVSMLEGVQSLRQGHFILFDGSTDSLEELPYLAESDEQVREDPRLKEQDATAQLRHLLERSVQQRMMSDVPLGSFLSGGIDSSVIAGLAHRFDPDLRTFCIGFSDSPEFSEHHYAESMATHLGTAHETILLDNGDLLDSLPEFLDELDEPFADSSALLVYILSKRVKKRITVSLSGDGADELFAGYNKYRAFERAAARRLSNSMIRVTKPLIDRLPSARDAGFGNRLRQLKRYAAGLSVNGEERYRIWSSLLAPETAERLLNKELRWTTQGQSWHHFNEGDAKGLLDVLLKDQDLVLGGDMLVKVDRMSMASGLEVRVPFLDRSLVKWSRSLPWDYRSRSGTGKWILRTAFKDLLPTHIIDRPKQGFEVPLLPWMRGPLRSSLETYFEADFLKDQGVFDQEAISAMLSKIDQRDVGEAPSNLWALMVFQHWYRKTILAS